MTREILFRGLRTDGGGWVEGDLVHHHPTGRTFIAKGLAEPIIEVHPDTVGQYIRTINGQRFFDGDIFIHMNHPETTHKVEIIDGEPTVWQNVVIQGVNARLFSTNWIKDRAGLSVFAAALADTFKIIGTIHDHLLEANP
jgi:hypothetical protein